MSYTQLAIVLPCYNPTEGWEANLIENIHRIERAMSGVTVQVVLVNDGSSNGILPTSITSIQSKISNFSFFENQINQGKGATVRKGMANIEADFYIYTDIDFPYKTQSFIKIAKALLEEKADIVAGEKSQNYYEQVPRFRQLISKFLQWCTKSILRLPTADTQCGLKGFNNKGKVVFMDTKIDRYLFDLEFLLLANQQKNLKTQFLPVELREGVEFSQVGFHLLFKEGLNFLKLLLR